MRIEEERQLVEALKKGSPHAASKLYREHLPLIYGYTVQRVGSRQDAEDITAQTFLIMVQSIHAFEGRSNFKNWLFGIAKTLLKAHWRKHYSIQNVALDSVIHSLGFWDTDESKINDSTYDTQIRKLNLVLKKLDTKYRTVLECRFFQRMSIKETAELMDITISNTKVIQHRAIKQAAQLAAEMKL